MHPPTLCLPLALASACHPALASSAAPPPSPQVLQLAFSPDGGLLAERFVDNIGTPGLHLRTPNGGHVASRLFDDEFALFGLSWSPDGQALAVLGDDSLMILDHQLTRLATHGLPLNHHGADLAWDPQDQGIVALPAAQSALFWLELESSRLTALALREPALSVRWHPMGDHLAISLVDQHTLLWPRQAVTGGR